WKAPSRPLVRRLRWTPKLARLVRSGRVGFGCGCRVSRTIRDANSADGDVGRRRRAALWRAVRTNQAGGDHGAAIAARIAHFLDILADEFVGGFRMPGIDLAHITHED